MQLAFLEDPAASFWVPEHLERTTEYRDGMTAIARAVSNAEREWLQAALGDLAKE